MLNYSDMPIRDSDIESIPEEVLEKLLRIPYFAEDYGEDTIKKEDFETIEPSVVANKQLLNAEIGFEDYIK